MKTKKKAQLFALAHDGFFDGDNSFYFPSYPIPYVDGMTLNDVKKGHLKLHEDEMRRDGASQGSIKAELECIKEDTIGLIKGAVVVDGKTIKAMSAIWESEPGNDSAVYGCNRSAKRVAWTMRKRVIGKRMSG